MTTMTVATMMAVIRTAIFTDIKGLRKTHITAGIVVVTMFESQVFSTGLMGFVIIKRRRHALTTKCHEQNDYQRS